MIINDVDIPVFQLMNETFIDLLDNKPIGVTDSTTHMTVIRGVSGTMANNITTAFRDIIREGTRSSNVIFVLRSFVSDSGVHVPSNTKSFALTLLDQIELEGCIDQPRPNLYWKDLIRNTCDKLSLGTVELNWMQNESINQQP